MTTTSHSPAPTQPATVIVVDDDPQVLDSVAGDVRSRYGRTYRVLAESSGRGALTQVEHLARRGAQVALVLTDQRMPDMSGTDLLVRAKEVQPHLRSVLLTAYADTDAAIQAINEISLDHYVMKPWDPPEEHLFPVLDEVLEEWTATRPRPETGLRAIGDRWSAASHRMRDFLARNQVPFRWIDVDLPEAAPLLAAVGPGARLPVLLLEDGRAISDPSLSEISETLQLSTRSEVDFHDLIIIGAGPAGLAAAVYGASEGLSTLVVEAEAPGGQAGTSSRIENYLGFPAGVSGSELSRRALAQARRFGASIVTGRRAVGLRAEDPYRVVVLDDGEELHCASVIVATGVQYRQLDIPGVSDLTGQGIYYGAASTEAAAMTGGRVVVVGGGNSAGQAALNLERYAEEVLIVVRADSLRGKMSSYLCDRIGASDSISVRYGSNVTGVEGNGRLEAVQIKGPAGEEELDTVGMFIFIGGMPHTEWLKQAVATDESGFLLTGPHLTADRWGLERSPYLLETSLPAVFAVGDTRATSVKRVASAVGEGTIAVQFVHQVLAGM